MKKIITLMMALILLGACSTQKTSDLIEVTATTTMIHDLVEQIGKDKVNVTGMMKAGVDPHSYKARPSDVMAIDNADIVAYNGVHLEAKLVDIFDSLKDQGTFLIKLEDGIDPSRLIGEGDGIHDPHIWFDVELWRESAIYVAQMLSTYDESSKDYYQANLDAYLLELDDLEEYIITNLEQIPKQQRVLVTAHDAFTYFGKAYGVKVEGVQGINSQSEAGIKDIKRLADDIIDNGIRSVYSESSVPIKTIEALVAAVQNRNYDLKIGGELYSDSLKQNTTYIETYKENIDTIVEGLK